MSFKLYCLQGKKNNVCKRGAYYAYFWQVKVLLLPWHFIMKLISDAAGGHSIEQNHSLFFKPKVPNFESTTCLTSYLRFALQSNCGITIPYLEKTINIFSLHLAWFQFVGSVLTSWTCRIIWFHLSYTYYNCKSSIIFIS